MLKILNLEEAKRFFRKSVFGEFQKEEREIRKILNSVKKNGDSALLKFTKKFDKTELKISELKVSEDEIRSAYSLIEKDFLKALRKAKKNIEEFHQVQFSNLKQISKNYNLKKFNNGWLWQKKEGIFLGQKIEPIQSVGIYIPGGLAPYPSTVLMTVIPAKVAKVKKIIITTPPNKEKKVNPHILVACAELGVRDIYKLGGAQAIAALTYGTKSIPPVDKIIGPGNIYVTLAKKLVYGDTDIDLLAGPSEILILADESAKSSFIAADLIAQAEHGAVAGKFPAAICLTNSNRLAKEINLELKKQLQNLSREKIILKALKENSGIVLFKNIKEAIEFINWYSPEHLQLMVKEPLNYLKDIKNAGAIFLGEYSPTVVGDYFAGPSHVLPTSSAAKFSSGLNIQNFLKSSSIIFYNKKNLEEEKKYILKLAEIEGLFGHANSLKIRFSE